jgi:hypothetical protein
MLKGRSNSAEPSHRLFKKPTDASQTAHKAAAFFNTLLMALDFKRLIL